MKILIVDDSKAMRMIVMRTLRQAGFADHTLEEAGNGNEALTKIQAGAPDLILSDWNMPEKSGLELLQALKESGSTIKFGFVTSEGTPEMKQKSNRSRCLIPHHQAVHCGHLQRNLGATCIMSAPNASEWLDAFVAATDELATTALALGPCAVSRDGNELPTGMPGPYIGFVSDAASLQVGLVSTPQGCQAMAKALLGMTSEDENLPDADLADALGEVVNIVAGTMKTRLSPQDPSIQLGLPFFVHGHIQTKSEMERAVAEGTIGELPVKLIVLRQPHR